MLHSMLTSDQEYYFRIYIGKQTNLITTCGRKCLNRLVGKSEPQTSSNRADSNFDYHNRNTPTPIQYR